MEVRRPIQRDAHCYGLQMQGVAAATGPEQMRASMASYVRSMHRAYIEATEPMTPGDRARLPLPRSTAFTVLAVGTRYLHILGTTEHLPAPLGPEVQLDDELGDLKWSLRFFDPVITPQLGMIDEREAPEPLQVREALGIRSVLYHLSLPPGGGLTPHHAQHAGTGLAHSHAAADRDFSTMAALAPAQGPIVNEMHMANTNDLPVAHLLLARHLLARCLLEPDDLTADPTDFAGVRRQTLSVLRSASA